MLKICSNCKEEKPLNEFYKNKSKKDGLQTICKKCTKSNDKLRVTSGENKKRCKIKYLKMMENESFVVKEKQRKSDWRNDNIETHREINRNHYRKNKEYYYNKVEKRRSLLNNLEADFTTEQWKECKNQFNNLCAYCGTKDNLTKEHFIPVTKGGAYTVGNIIPVCKSCNSSKCDSPFFEWYPKQSFYSKDREQKIFKYLTYNKNKNQQQLALF